MREIQINLLGGIVFLFVLMLVVAVPEARSSEKPRELRMEKPAAVQVYVEPSIFFMLESHTFFGLGFDYNIYSRLAVGARTSITKGGWDMGLSLKADLQKGNFTPYFALDVDKLWGFSKDDGMYTSGFSFGLRGGLEYLWKNGFSLFADVGANWVGGVWRDQVVVPFPLLYRWMIGFACRF